MSLTEISLDELLTPPRWAGKLCTVAQAIAEITDADTKAKVIAACDDPRVPSGNLATAFVRLLGESPAQGTLKRHQRRNVQRADGCKCA